MKILPFVKYTLESDYSIDEVRERLKANIDVRNNFINFSRPKNVFHGKLELNSFKISKTLKRQKNSFLAVVIGEFFEKENKTCIHVNMRLDILVLVFMSLWLTGTGGVGIGLLIGGLLNGTFEGFLFIPLGMFCFGLTLTLIAFHSGKKQSLNALIEILGAKEVEEEKNDPLSPIQRF